MTDCNDGDEGINPGYVGGYWTERHPMISYSTTPDLAGNAESDVCTTPAMLANNGRPFVGVNAMEYYLR